MTIKLLELYNTAATQEWSMYDNDTLLQEEMDQSLVLALNKAITEILYSYEFPFRLRTKVIIAIPNIAVYSLPAGLIKKDERGRYIVKYNSSVLDFSERTERNPNSTGVPGSFCIDGNKIILSSKPEEKGILTIEYYTLAIGENAAGEEIFALKNVDDTLSVPSYLEELLKNAVVSRAMLNSISAEGDENYSAYKKQSETAYRLLIKYSKGVTTDKAIKF